MLVKIRVDQQRGTNKVILYNFKGLLFEILVIRIRNII